MANRDEEALELLQRVRNTLVDVKNNTKSPDSMGLLVTRRRLLVIHIIASTIVKNIDSLLEQESELENND